MTQADRPRTSASRTSASRTSPPRTSAPRTSAKDRALRLLSVRSRSREELRRRLTRAGYEPAEIETALGDLERVGLVDDERFARELAGHQLERKMMGRRAVLGSLRRVGIDRELAERAVGEHSTSDDEVRAEGLARRRLARLSSLDEPTAYRRLVGFLQRRGYHPATAHEACRRVLAERGGE